MGVYTKLVAAYQIKLIQNAEDSFLDRWFLLPIREEIDYLYQAINQITDEKIKQVLIIVMTRSIRSCRATSHADLGTLKKPILATYYCRKHGKICKPIFSLASWFSKYSKDTLRRLNEFKKIKSSSFQVALAGDSRNIDLVKAVATQNNALAKIIEKQKIKGVFSSPPYLGLINYHEQHAYAYDLFNFQRSDDLEIGSLDKGQNNESKQAYVTNIANVLVNCQRFLQKDYHVFLVANDKHNLYPKIAKQAGMRIINQFKRPVLNRVEKDRLTPYAETIFHLKEA